MSVVKQPGVVQSLDPGPINPGFLAMTEDFRLSLVTVGAGGLVQLCVRDGKRTGITLVPDASQTAGIGIFPRYPTPAEVAILGKQTGPVLITMDIYRVAVMSEWWATAVQAGTIQVYEFFRI